MASTYSDLKIELIGTGEQSGTWGVTTDTNLGTALGEAITGSADVNFASAADVTVTLTNTNSTQTARNLRLNLTESSTGVGYVGSLILGSGCQIEKLYLINNGTTGAKTIKNTTGTGITIPAGTSMFVFNNGTNVVNAITAVTNLTASGSVGIGTSSPNYTLSVNSSTGINAYDGIASKGRFVLGDPIDYRGYVGMYRGVIGDPTTSGNNLVLGSLDAIGFTTGSTYFSGQTERMRIDGSGNVGIGAASTGAQLYQYLASGTTQRSIQNGSVTVLEYASSVVNAAAYGTISNHPLIFTTNNNQVATLTTAGIFLVGCTATPNVGTTGEYGFSTSSNEVVISKNTSGTTAAVYIRTNAGASKTAISFYNDTTQVGYISTTTSATAYVTSSDYRLKDDVTPMTGALATVSQLKPVTYKWKADGSNGQGFIAHELQAVVPDCVVGEKDAVDEEGKPVYQGVDTSFLVATLTSAIQELNAKVNAQAAEIATLKTK